MLIASPWISGCNYVIAQPFQHLLGHIENQRIVFDQQDSLTRVFSQNISFLVRYNRVFSMVSGQIDFEPCSLANFTADDNEAIVLFNDAINR